MNYNNLIIRLVYGLGKGPVYKEGEHREVARRPITLISLEVLLNNDSNGYNSFQKLYGDELNKLGIYRERVQQRLSGSYAVYKVADRYKINRVLAASSYNEEQRTIEDEGLLESQTPRACIALTISLFNKYIDRVKESYPSRYSHLVHHKSWKTKEANLYNADTLIFEAQIFPELEDIIVPVYEFITDTPKLLTEVIN